MRGYDRIEARLARFCRGRPLLDRPVSRCDGCGRETLVARPRPPLARDGPPLGEWCPECRRLVHRWDGEEPPPRYRLREAIEEETDS